MCISLTFSYTTSRNSSRLFLLRAEINNTSRPRIRINLVEYHNGGLIGAVNFG